MDPVKYDVKERSRAALVCGAAVFFPIMGPVVALVLFQKQPYVRFHAWRCLLQELIATLIIGTLCVLSFSWTVYSLSQKGWDLSQMNWWAVLAKSVITWALLALWGMVNTALSVMDVGVALSGQLPSRVGLSGRLAWRWSGLARGS